MPARKQVGTIDLTPSWAHVMDICILALQQGTHAGQVAAAQQLRDLGKSLDNPDRVSISRSAWQDAYAAFSGEFDTPIARRRHTNEFAEDARKRLAELNRAITEK